MMNHYENMKTQSWEAHSFSDLKNSCHLWCWRLTTWVQGDGVSVCLKIYVCVCVYFGTEAAGSRSHLHLNMLRVRALVSNLHMCARTHTHTITLLSINNPIFCHHTVLQLHTVQFWLFSTGTLSWTAGADTTTGQELKQASMCTVTQ